MHYPLHTLLIDVLAVFNCSLLYLCLTEAIAYLVVFKLLVYFQMCSCL